MGYLCGIDLGSSSVKCAIVDGSNGKVIGTARYPEVEMKIHAPQPGWAEQNPDDWWDYVVKSIQLCCTKSNISISEISSIGIAYQMHGLVILDKEGKVLNPAIIWCDGRAVEIGKQAYHEIGENYCDRHLLNSPGNFTASKLGWIAKNRPDLFAQIDKVMLPGDYISYRLTKRSTTTINGLSEGIFWDFINNEISPPIMSYWKMESRWFPEIIPTFSQELTIDKDIADQYGFSKTLKVNYRAGDQPNNALSLGVLSVGQIAATAGTSGVVYAVCDSLINEHGNRINVFAHVGHSAQKPLLGSLLCINGTGILYSWLRSILFDGTIPYGKMEELASQVPPGSGGLMVLPFGNGPERMLGNKDLGAHIQNLNFNRHSKADLVRACLEGLAFSFYFGIKTMTDGNIRSEDITVGNDNLFQSRIFSQTLADLSNLRIKIIDTSGAIGAAIASDMKNNDDTQLLYNTIKIESVIEPNTNNSSIMDFYKKWENNLIYQMNK